MKYFCCIVFGMALFSCEGKAWEVIKEDSSLYYWVMAGSGTTVQEWSTAGISNGLEFGFEKRGHVLLLRWMQNNEAPPEPVGDDRKYDVIRSPDEDISEVGLLYGRCHRSSVFILSGAAGLSYINGMRRGMLLKRTIAETIDGGIITETWEEKPFQQIGVPVVLQVSVQALTMLGIQLELLANLNNERPYTGWLISFQIGHLRKE